jgi:DNA (cytosine-5)-methyltransferase 1
MDYNSKSYKELIAFCKENNIKKYNKKSKHDIIEIITKHLLLNTIMLSNNITFIDLFCGIGGFHQAITSVIPLSKCVFASDIDHHIQNTYNINYNIKPLGDIKVINETIIPKFDLLCAGFPCQPFSTAQWKDKKAFDDIRGTLFFEILKIIDFHRPKCILLENVANLIKINKGTVIESITNSLQIRGYKVSYYILNSYQFGIPQNRDRVYIVATISDKLFDFTNLLNRSSNCKLEDILDINVSEDYYIDSSTYTLLNNDQIKKQIKSGLKFCGYLHGTLRKVGIKENTEHLSRVHKQLMRITHPTLSASETSGRYYIYEESTKRVRKLTLNECYKLMSFPSSFIKNSSISIAYKQIGNSVCITVIEEIIKEMIKQAFL